ncbi:uncharacterized protein LOC142536981 isoform X2 [Primulina tabacum]|uniref:uncharacterized protein LOC142536981 isoform X2 n=1 Tax=Primulina tabacum TaxID=48773 RepID=UPI003F59674D
MAVATPSPFFLWFLLVLASVFPSISSAADFSLVVSEITTLHLSPSLVVEKSPGLKPGTKVKCDRVQIHGLPRRKHLNKFANSVKVKVSHANQTGRSPNIEMCFHRNLSLGIGMCSQDKWERFTEGLWIKSMSPFDHKLLDIRMAGSNSESLQVSLAEEFFLYRVIFLFWGILMMALASWLSKSLIFYYSGAMAVGVFLVALMVLFQGMKLLPTGRKSSLAIFLYSCFVGLGTFLLQYVPRLFRSLLIEIGLSEDIYDPMVLFLLVFLTIFGAWLGYWVVRKFVLTEDGSIDLGVSHFVAWAIRIVSSVMILQCSVDPLLAAEALVCGIFISSVLKKLIRPKLVRRVYKKLSRFDKINHGKSPDPYTSPANISSDAKPLNRTPYSSSRDAKPLNRTTYSFSRASTSQSPTRLSNAETFYSTFHETPYRRKFSKAEWNKFSRESTQQALEGLVSSPDFSKWAVAHADRITLAPKKEEVENKNRRWFSLF